MPRTPLGKRPYPVGIARGCLTGSTTTATSHGQPAESKPRSPGPTPNFDAIPRHHNPWTTLTTPIVNKDDPRHYNPRAPTTRSCQPSERSTPKFVDMAGKGGAQPKPTQPQNPATTIINHRKPTLDLFKINGRVIDQPAVILIDNGSTGNFLSTTFAATHGVKTLEAPSQLVNMADGTQKTQNRRAFRLPLDLGNHHEKVDFDLLPLATYDAILGQPWLRKHGVKINCEDNTSRR